MRIPKSAVLVAALFFFAAVLGMRVAARSGRRASSSTPLRSARRSMSSTWPRRIWSRCARIDSRDVWNTVFRVAVAADQAPMLGDYRIDGNRIRFTPMFPLDPGRQYHVTFSPPGAVPIIATIGLPATHTTPTTVVAQVYPSGEVIPENQLRLYVHFSAPMGMKGGLDYVHLLDEQGKEVVDPFLPLDAEFWNDDRTRYTVFFDPGRQKRGIPVIVEMGRSLTEGKSYTLVVDKEWRDGNGLPLKEIVQAHLQGRPAGRAPARSHGVADPGAGRRHARAAHRGVPGTARSRIAAARA